MASANQLTPEEKQNIQTALASMPGQEKDMLRRMLLGKQIGTGDIERATAFEKAAYGYQKSPYTIQKVGAWAQDKRNEYLIEKKIEDDEGKRLVDLMASDPAFYAATEKSVEDVHARWRRSLGANMATLKYNTDKHVMETYPKIWGTHMEDDLGVIIPNIAKFAVDPTTLLPLGAGIRAAALVGGTIAAYDVAFHQLYEQGAIDGEELFLFTMLGAIATPLVAVGGRRVAHWVAGKLRKGEKVTSEELSEMLMLEHQKPANDTINVPPAAGQVAKQLGKPAPKGGMEVPPGGVKGPQKLLEHQKKLPAPDWEKTQRFMNMNVKELAQEINRVSHKSQADIVHPPTKKQMDDINNAYADMQKALPDDAPKARRDPATGQFKLSKDRYGHYTVPSIKSLFQGFTDKQAQALRTKAGKKYLRKEVEDLKKLKKGEIERLGARLGRDQAANAQLVKQMNNEITPDHIMKLMNTAGQGGFAEGILVQHIAGALVGGATGLAIGDTELGFLGLIAGGFAPIWMPKLWGGVGRLDETWLSKRWRMNSDSAKHFTSPETFIRAIPGVGDKIADRLHDFGIYKSRIQALSLHAVENLIRSLPATKVAAFIHVMQTGARTTDKQVKEATDATRKMFQEFNRLARSHKIINKEKFKALRDSKNYWPRIYNHQFLETKEGHMAFINLLTKEGFREPGQGERILGSLLRTDKGGIPTFKMRKNADGTVVHILSKEQADKIMLRRVKVATNKRSTHLDHERKLKVSDEKVLQRFMIQDPLTVITEYGHDVATRLSSAKHFGPNEEVLKTLANSAWGKNIRNQKDLDYILDTFYTALGDSKAASVAKQINLSDATRHMLGSVNSFETLKLSLAQILNMTQATVNGMTFASKHGAGTAVRTYTKAMRDVFTKEGQDFAARSGAALETTIMGMITEHSANATVLGFMGKSEFRGSMSFLNTLNNPSKFLKHTGFMRIEKFQRNVAANQGKAMFEEAMEKYAAASSGKFTGAQGKRMKAKAVAIAKDLGMKEENLIARSPEQTQAVLEIAGLEFSNRINHTNNFDRLPASWRGPYARVALKFKSFMFHQGAFIKDNVLAPAHKFLKTGGQEGSLTPIAAYVGVGTPMGMSSDQIRRMLASDDRELTNTQRMLRGISAVGAAGLALDAAVLFTTNPYSGSAYGLMGGPALSSMFGASRAIIDSTMGLSGKPAIRQAIKDVGGGVPGKKFLIDMFRDKPDNLMRLSVEYN